MISKSLGKISNPCLWNDQFPWNGKSQYYPHKNYYPVSLILTQFHLYLSSFTYTYSVILTSLILIQLYLYLSYTYLILHLYLSYTYIYTYPVSLILTQFHLYPFSLTVFLWAFECLLRIMIYMKFFQRTIYFFQINLDSEQEKFSLINFFQLFMMYRVLLIWLSNFVCYSLISQRLMIK